MWEGGIMKNKELEKAKQEIYKKLLNSEKEESEEKTQKLRDIIVEIIDKRINKIINRSRNSIIDLVFRCYLCDEVNTIKEVEIGDILEFLDMIEYYQKHLLYKSKVIKLDETITEIEWIVNNLNNENNFYTSHLMKQLEKLKEIRSLL